MCESHYGEKNRQRVFENMSAKCNLSLENMRCGAAFSINLQISEKRNLAPVPKALGDKCGMCGERLDNSLQMPYSIKS